MLADPRRGVRCPPVDSIMRVVDRGILDLIRHSRVLPYLAKTVGMVPEVRADGISPKRYGSNDRYNRGYGEAKEVYSPVKADRWLRLVADRLCDSIHSPFVTGFT